jgi:hypothetical protein
LSEHLLCSCVNAVCCMCTSMCLGVCWSTSEDCISTRALIPVSCISAHLTMSQVVDISAEQLEEGEEDAIMWFCEMIVFFKLTGLALSEMETHRQSVIQFVNVGGCVLVVFFLLALAFFFSSSSALFFLLLSSSFFFFCFFLFRSSSSSASASSFCSSSVPVSVHLSSFFFSLLQSTCANVKAISNLHSDLANGLVCCAILAKADVRSVVGCLLLLVFPFVTFCCGFAHVTLLTSRELFVLLRFTSFSSSPRAWTSTTCKTSQRPNGYRPLFRWPFIDLVYSLCWKWWISTRSLDKIQYVEEPHVVCFFVRLFVYGLFMVCFFVNSQLNSLSLSPTCLSLCHFCNCSFLC